MVEHVCGIKAKQMIQVIPLSNDTIHRRISEMSQDICQQVIEQIKSSPAKMSLQLDVANFSQLKNEFPFCEPLQQTTKATDIMQKIQDFFDKNSLTWDIVGSICTNGAPAMMGMRSFFPALVK